MSSLVEFERIVQENAQAWEPPPPPAYDEWLKRNYVRWIRRRQETLLQRLGPRFASEWGHLLPLAPTEWLVEGLIPRTSYAMWYGYRGSGKSFLAIALAYSAATGRDFLGHRIPEKFGSIMFIGEKNTAFPKRTRAWVTEAGVADTALPVRVVQHVPDLTSPASVADTIEFIQSVAKPQIEALGVPLRMIFLDTLAKCVPGGSVVDNATATKAVAAIAKIVEATGVAVVTLAHPAKGVAVHESSAKGAGEWEDAADTVFRIERTKHGRALINTKQSDGPEAPPCAFELRQVDVGQDAFGRAITSCVVEPWTFEARAPRKSPVHRDTAELVDTLRSMLRGCEGSEAAAPKVPLRAFKDAVIAGGYRVATKPDASNQVALRAWNESTRKALDRAIASAIRNEVIVIDGEEIALPM